jgi:deoxyribodipyrimidine photo-lyase
MKKKYDCVAYIFRRDLRIEDNTALLQASHDADAVIPMFIIDPRQVCEVNRYRSLKAIQFMRESLVSLDRIIRNTGGQLYVWQGNPEEVLHTLLQSVPVRALYINRDYTPFSIMRDEAIKKVCHQYTIEYKHYDDYLLTRPEDLVSSGGTPYSIFSPFFKKASRAVIVEPDITPVTNWYTKPIQGAAQSVDAVFKHYDRQVLHVHGSHDNAHEILSNLQVFASYGTTRDYPAIGTTNLSAYNKFGLVSIRQVYHALKKTLGPFSPLIRQLFWRDFFTHTAYTSPFVFGQPFNKKYANIEWSNDQSKFQAWCEGCTGFPIIDAGMRQLNLTGYMHNRVRLLTASFLVKDLHIDWRLGELYFAQHLTDYDPAVNNGNWQWVASTGTDAQPYFRIFSPWIQQKKFDSDCRYIKQWVHELRGTDPRIIHAWFQVAQNHAHTYIRPIVDHAIESKLTKYLYKQALSHSD